MARHDGPYFQRRSGWYVWDSCQEPGIEKLLDAPPRMYPMCITWDDLFKIVLISDSRALNTNLKWKGPYTRTHYTTPLNPTTLSYTDGIYHQDPAQALKMVTHLYGATTLMYLRLTCKLSACVACLSGLLLRSHYFKFRWPFRCYHYL